MEKICNKCKTLKNIIEFQKCPKCKDGYGNKCKECRKDVSLIWRQNNPDSHKKWVERNIEYDKKRKKKHYEQNKNKYKKQSTEYRKNNKDKVNLWVREYRKKRFSEDEVFKMTFIVRNRIRKILKSPNELKVGRTFDLIGCTPQELVKHIESLFTEGMSWDNHGEWHIDHIIPLCSAKTKDEIIRLCHYSNLQPLWALDNLKKGKSIWMI